MNRHNKIRLTWALLGSAILLYGLAIGSCSMLGVPDKHAKHGRNIARAVSARRPSPDSASTAVYATGKNLPAAEPPSTGATAQGSTVQTPPAPPPPGSGTPAGASPAENVIEVLLSFDDGPHVNILGHDINHTEKVFRTLKDNVLKKEIKAAFFVQTHAPGRGATQAGQDIIAILAKEGHVVGIHTGSTADHASHCVRAGASPYDTDGNGVVNHTDGANGLESDMIRAKARIQRLTGSEARYVRPTYGERNRTVEATYRRQHLKMILWDIESADNTSSPSVDEVNQKIDEGMRRCFSAGKTQLVILFHDINSQTAANLEEYLANISISAGKLGKTVVFPTSAERVTQILDARTDR